MPIAAIDKAVAAYFDIEPEDFARHGRSVGTAKIAAVELACRLTACLERSIGLHYGGIGSAAVSTIHRKVREGRYDVASPLNAILPKVEN